MYFELDRGIPVLKMIDNAGIISIKVSSLTNHKKSLISKMEIRDFFLGFRL